MFGKYLQKLIAESKKVLGYIKSIGRKQFFSTTAAMVITLAILIGFWNFLILPKQQAMKPEIMVENPKDQEDAQKADTSDEGELAPARTTGTEVRENEQREGTLTEQPPDLQAMEKPLEGKLVGNFGFTYSPTFDDYRYHNGIDIQATKGKQVNSVLDGIVESAALTQQEAYRIVIDHGGGWKTAYSHLGTAEVYKGDKVKAGTLIGKVGTPGKNETATGFHLHFEIMSGDKHIDPAEYLSYQEARD